MSEWKECKLGDLVSLEYGKSLSDYREAYGKYPVFGTNGEIGQTDYYLSPIPSVIIGRKGAYRGVHYSKCPFWAIDTAFFIKPKSQNIDLFFLYNFLLTQDINAMDSGSAIPSTDRYEIYDLAISLPPLTEQRSIAGVLSSLDDKIDLLHRQNKTLEGMAEALWRKMFIEDADPKWKKGKLGDYITVKGGTTPSTTHPEYWDGNVYWTTPSDLSASNKVFLHETERKITEKGLSQIGSGLLPVGTVLLSSRAPVGYLCISNIPVAINQGYIAIICDRLFSVYYVYHWIRSNLDMIINSANGSTFLEISKSVFKDLDAKVPDEEDIKKFDSFAKPIFDKILANEIQVLRVDQLRDSLLPKLMSGEIRVNL